MKLFASLLMFCMTIAVGIVSMMWGWGVQPQSWPIIIGCAAFMGVAMIVTAAINQ